MAKYLTGRCSSTYLKNIRYKGALVPFKYCTLCLKVVQGMWTNSAQRCVKLSSKGHECVSAMENMARIYAEERSRSDFFRLEKLVVWVWDFGYNVDCTICTVLSEEIHWYRLHILQEETVDPSCLYIHPVRLDGADIDFAFCTRCHSFLPKSHAYDASMVRGYGVSASTHPESPGIHRCQLGGRRAARLREEEGGASVPHYFLYK